MLRERKNKRRRKEQRWTERKKDIQRARYDESGREKKGKREIEYSEPKRHNILNSFDLLIFHVFMLKLIHVSFCFVLKILSRMVKDLRKEKGDGDSW